MCPISGDQDTNMSSPSSEGSEMFPAANEPPSAASPPNSQEQQIPEISSTKATVRAIQVHHQTQIAHQHPTVQVAPPTGFGAEGGLAASHEPGWSWKSKQAQEEYARAIELVVDKQFPTQLQEFGDILEEGMKGQQGSAT